MPAIVAAVLATRGAPALLSLTFVALILVLPAIRHRVRLNTLRD